MARDGWMGRSRPTSPNVAQTMAAKCCKKLIWMETISATAPPPQLHICFTGSSWTIVVAVLRVLSNLFLGYNCESGHNMVHE
ncbi:hypothetical protein KIN20_028393 [Parelaphostrongylus tenuis]|uniref:Uncharacterized protein n=1 Tax=Parelaphostrongylus tenuis TaxID=148309 RepID=A0AAD5WER9_PARTN|nr:hypothetical protein KIN20_028393 [Parelaphostrongylus tenuis]